MLPKHLKPFGRYVGQIVSACAALLLLVVWPAILLAGIAIVAAGFAGFILLGCVASGHAQADADRYRRLVLATGR